MAQTKEPFSKWTLTAIEAALQSGEILTQGFGTQFSISSKEGKHNLVTEYDHRSEKAILQFIQEKFPSSNFLAEESGLSGKDKGDLLWIIDPLDGTVNFAHQIPFFAVSIALQKEGEVVSGVVYQPILKELFVAEKGKGAFFNGKKIQVTAISDLNHAILGTGFPYNLDQQPASCIDPLVNMLKIGSPIRRLGSAAMDLSYVAAGRFDAFFEFSLAPWDCAAGNLLIEEAGGKISHWDGSDFDLFGYKTILASNGKIHESAVKTLTKPI